MALVRDNCLVPTLDAPELGYIRESTNEQYVPDILYKVRTYVYIHTFTRYVHTFTYIPLQGTYVLISFTCTYMCVCDH